MEAAALKVIIDELLAEIETADPRTDPIAQADRHWRLGSAFQALADYEARIESLRLALDAYGAALDLCPADVYQVQRARLQNERATAYRKLAIHEDTLANLNRAIVCHRQALKLLPKDSPDTARSHAGIANAYQTLAGTNDWDRVAHLLRAINAYESALPMMEQDEGDYAATQNNLGLAYARLAQHADKMGNMERAIRAHRIALNFYGATSHPHQHAATQRNLGIAYEGIGQASAARECWQAAAHAYAEVGEHESAAEMEGWLHTVEHQAPPPPAEEAQKFRDFMRQVFRRRSN